MGANASSGAVDEPPPRPGGRHTSGATKQHAMAPPPRNAHFGTLPLPRPPEEEEEEDDELLLASPKDEEGVGKQVNFHDIVRKLGGPTALAASPESFKKGGEPTSPLLKARAMGVTDAVRAEFATEVQRLRMRFTQQKRGFLDPRSQRMQVGCSAHALPAHAHICTHTAHKTPARMARHATGHAPLCPCTRVGWTLRYQSACPGPRLCCVWHCPTARGRACLTARKTARA